MLNKKLITWKITTIKQTPGMLKFKKKIVFTFKQMLLYKYKNILT